MFWFFSVFPGCAGWCQSGWEVQQDSDPKCVLLPGLKSNPERASETLIQKRDLCDTHLETVKKYKGFQQHPSQRREITSCLPRSANLLSALAELKCWFTWESFHRYGHETISLLQEGVKEWEGGLSFNHTKISRTFILAKNCSSRFSISFWHQTI